MVDAYALDTTRPAATAVSQIVARLLAREPADRHANGADVARDLRTPSAPVQAQPRAELADHGIAVLPFGNMSTDAENE